MNRNRVINRWRDTVNPIWRHANANEETWTGDDGKTYAVNPKTGLPEVVKDKGIVLANVTSIIGNLSSSVNSVFSFLDKKQADAQQQQQKQSNTMLWVLGGAVVVVIVLVVVLKRK